MKSTIIGLILIHLFCGASVAMASDSDATSTALKKKHTHKLHHTKAVKSTAQTEKKIVPVNFVADEDNLEPRAPEAQKPASGPANLHPEFEVLYSSDKNFGTENDGKFNRGIASVDSKKPKPIPLKKALKSFKQQTDHDFAKNYE
jgi:hypothetical protein